VSSYCDCGLSQISDDDVATSERRQSLFERLIAESDEAYQLVSLSILLSAWPQFTGDFDGYDLLCYVVCYRAVSWEFGK